MHLIVAPQLCDGWRDNYSTKTSHANEQFINYPGNTKGESITVQLTSCLTCLELVCFVNKNKNHQM
jgi:hypothetical protein